MATAMLTWRKKKLRVSSSKMYPVNDFSASVKIKQKKSSSKKKRVELEEIEFTAICVANAGINPQDEYISWRKLIKRSGVIYLHGKAWRTNPFILQSVSLGNTILDDYGRLRYGELKLKFKEKNKKEKSDTKVKKAAASEAAKARKKVNKKKKTKVTFKAGSKVRIIGNYWVDGQKIGASLKKKNVTIQKISGSKAYIAEGSAWIYINILSLVK